MHAGNTGQLGSLALAWQMRQELARLEETCFRIKDLPCVDPESSIVNSFESRACADAYQNRGDGSGVCVYVLGGRGAYCM